MAETVERVAVEIEGRDTGASATLKTAADVVAQVRARLEELAQASRRAAQESVRGAAEAGKAEQEKARAAERAAATLVAMQQRAEIQRKAILARGDALTQARLQLQQELAAYRQHAAAVVGQEQQKQATLQAIRQRYLAQKQAILAQEQAAERGAASGGGVGGMAARPGQLGIQGLRRFNEPMEGARMALGALGATTNTAVGQLGFLAQAFANVGAKAGIWGAALVGAGAAVTALVKHVQETREIERQFDALHAKFGVTRTEVDAVAGTFERFGADLDRKTVQQLIGAGREAGVTTGQMIGLAEAAQRTAAITGAGWAEAFRSELAKVAEDAGKAKKAFDALVTARGRARRTAKEGETQVVGGEAIAEADKRIADAEIVLRFAKRNYETAKTAAESVAASQARDQAQAELDAARAARAAIGGSVQTEKTRETDEIEEKDRLELIREEAQERFDAFKKQQEAARRAREQAEREAEQRWQESLREGQQLRQRVGARQQAWADDAFLATFADQERGKIELQRRREIAELEKHLEERRALYEDEAQIEEERQKRLADINARAGRANAELDVKRAKEAADARKKVEAETIRAAKEARDAVQQDSEFFQAGVRAGGQFVTGLKAALESKENNDRVAGVLKTVGAILSAIPTPQTQAAGTVLSVFGEIASAFHDGGGVGPGGKRLTAHDGRYIDTSRRPVYALPGEGITDVATTALLGGSRGIAKLNRAAENGGAGGLAPAVHVGGVSIRIDGSRIDNIAALAREIGPAFEKAIIEGSSRVSRRMGTAIGPITR